MLARFRCASCVRVSFHASVSLCVRTDGALVVFNQAVLYSLCVSWVMDPRLWNGGLRMLKAGLWMQTLVLLPGRGSRRLARRGLYSEMGQHRYLIRTRGGWVCKGENLISIFFGSHLLDACRKSESIKGLGTLVTLAFPHSATSSPRFPAVGFA